MLAGLRVAKKIHEWQMDEERALLHWVGERVEALVAAEQPARALVDSHPVPRDHSNR